MGRPRTATVLKIRNGSAAHEPSVLRDESLITPKGKPRPPPWAVLDADRRQVFNYLRTQFAIPGVHGKPDGLLMLQLVDQIMVNRRTKDDPKQFSAYMRSGERIIKLMSELGFTPSSRLKFAPPLTGRLPRQAMSWNDIDR